MAPGESDEVPVRRRIPLVRIIGITLTLAVIIGSAAGLAAMMSIRDHQAALTSCNQAIKQSDTIRTDWGKVLEQAEPYLRLGDGDVQDPKTLELVAAITRYRLPEPPAACDPDMTTNQLDHRRTSMEKTNGQIQARTKDLRDAVAYLPHRVTVRAGDFADLGACDVIVNSVGKIELLRGTHDRVTEMDFTIPAVRGYAEKIKASGFDGVLINITNPCDIVTRELALHVGLPKGRVFGTGTGLDTSRLLSALARQTGIDHKSITCYMMGEHGNQQFAPWSCVSFRGMPLDTWAARDERFHFDRDALQKESIGGGWVTFSGKFCTEYGIATTAARMAYAVLHDEKVILPASAELTGEYGEAGLFAGVPCVIGASGVEEVVELPLTGEERATFHACCEGIRHNMEHLKEI